MSKPDITFTIEDHVQDEKYFYQTLEKAGLDLLTKDCIELTKEQSLVIRDIQKIIKEDTKHPNTISSFINGFKLFVNNNENFVKTLLHTNLSKCDEESVNTQIKIQQDSLCRILMNIDILQSNIISTILEELASRVSDNEAGLVRLLLNSLRYLSFINDSNKLTTQLLDILDIACDSNQVEILNCLPEILPDSQYDDVIKQFISLLESNSNLTGPIIDCLNSLSLNNKLQIDIQNYILNNLSSCKNEMFPILFEFLITHCVQEHLQNVLNKCRSVLDTLLGSESAQDENATTKALILSKIHSCAVIPKVIFEGWINIIQNINVNTDHKSIDILLLLILHSSSNTRKKPIESLIKKKIKSNTFTLPLLENLFRKYTTTQFLNECISSIIEIGICLIKSVDNKITDYGVQIFKIIFLHKYTSKRQRCNILHNLILLIGSSVQRSVEIVLSLLTHLSQYKIMQEHTNQLMGLLEKLDSYDLLAVKLVFDILCNLTCTLDSQEHAGGFKDEIHMLVRKQLSSSKKSVKVRGIISAIVAVKYITSVHDDDVGSSISGPEESIVSINNIPNENSRIAANLLDLVSTCCSSSPDFKSIYYDHLASMILSTENIDKYFLSWLFEIITNDFQDIFVTEDNPSFINGLEVSSQYSLNSLEEVDVTIHINIAKLLITGDGSIGNLAPLFRLLRILHYHHENGDLASIDALLGCGVLMPIVNDIKDYDTGTVKIISDCIFYCINWFREIISAFVTQKNKKLRQKVISRLDHLIHLEETLNECMKIIPDHKLPPSYVCSMSIQTNNSCSTKHVNNKHDPVSNISNLEITSTNIEQHKKKQTSIKKHSKEINFMFRDIDNDIILLLKYPMDQDNVISESVDIQPSIQSKTTITLKQFQYLMQDLVKKLDAVIKGTNLRILQFSVINSGNLITDSLKLLPCICRHFNVITDHLNKLINTAGEDLYSTEAITLKSTFMLVLKCFSLIFGWSGFQASKNLNILRDALWALRKDDRVQYNSVNRLIVAFAETISNCVNQCLYLPAGVFLIQTLQYLYRINKSPEIHKKIVEVSGKLIGYTWYNLDGVIDDGKVYVNNLNILTKAYLDGANVKTICALINSLQNQIVDLYGKTDRLSLLQSFNKSTYYIFYNNICSSLPESIKVEITSLTNNQHLTLWKTVALSMQGLMTIAKVHELKKILICFLKKSLIILKLFITHGIPILEIMLRTKTEEVIEIFKVIQTSTRFLHHLCCYSKLTKDISLIAFVPQFRLTLEELIYKVKGALIANNCSAAFWMGNLKNKNLIGDDICTQSTIVSDNSEKITEEESDDDILEENDDDETASEVFD